MVKIMNLVFLMYELCFFKISIVMLWVIKSDDILIYRWIFKDGLKIN